MEKVEKTVLVLYEIEKDVYGNGKDDECYRGEFENSSDLREWFEVVENKSTSKQNINRAIRKGYIVLDKFLIFRMNLDDNDNLLNF